MPSLPNLSKYSQPEDKGQLTGEGSKATTQPLLTPGILVEYTEIHEEEHYRSDEDLDNEEYKKRLEHLGKKIEFKDF